MIELMIAVAIVALLASIAVPSLQKWFESSKVRQASQELAQMSALIDQYAADNGGKYPANLGQVGLANRKDPWGGDYAYYNVQADGTSGARQTKEDKPVNEDYDLYSPGKDQQTFQKVDHVKAVDDVLRGRAGRFFGLASEY